MIEAIVFDFDGVLANSEPAHLAALTEVLQELGVAITPADYYQRYLGLDDAGVFRVVSEEHRVELDAAKIEALIERKAVIFDRLISGGDVLFPGAQACVERLAARYPLGIASGALRHEIEGILSGAGLTHFFSFIVASGETLRGKPHPDPYRRAAELHGRPPERCLAIEDSRWGIESAKTAGLKCVGIATTYGPSELATADAVISSLDEFTAAFIRSL